MKPEFSDFLKRFAFFIRTKQQGGTILYTVLFYTLWLVLNSVLSKKYDLHSLEGRMLGTATLQNYDVGARVSLFYECVVLLFFAFLLLNLLGYFIYNKKPGLLQSVEARLVNYASMAGVLLMLFQVFEFKVYETMEAVYFIHKLMLAAVFLRFIFFKRSVISLYHYVIVLTLSTAFYFPVADIVNLSGYVKNPDFYIVSFLFCLVFTVALLIYFKSPLRASYPGKWRLLVHALSPFMALPLVSILKDEIFLIFKAQGHPLSGQLFTWLILIVILCLISTLLYYRGRKTSISTEREILAKRYFPLLLFSLIAYAFYSYSIEFYHEMFESGNRYLAVMEYRLFGVIPTLEKFNSHLLSDYFFSAIYTWLNGMKAMEMELYDFLLIPISLVFYYYLLYFLSRSPFFAFFAVLFFPFYAALLPDGYCFGVLALMVLHKVLSQPSSLKNYVILFTTLAFLIYWRSDLGYSCVVTVPIIILFYHFIDPNFKIKWAHLLKALLIVFGTTALLFAALSAYRGVNIFYKLLYALNYLASAQTYGYNTIGWTNQPEYKMHYFVFPVLVCVILLALGLCFKFFNKTKGQRFSYLTLLFLCVYYFANFNRGLVRHSLIEWTDTFTSSYIYIIIPGTIFVFLRNRLQNIKFIVFFAFSFFMIITYALPHETTQKSLFERGIEKLTKTPNRDLAKLNGRVKDLPKRNADQRFIDFTKKYMQGDETFIDFTNNPMLYFYTNKITPSYFYQNPLCSHNDFLQDRFVADLKDYNTPYLLYAPFTAEGYTSVDRVPNSLRHYRMEVKRDTLIHYKKNPGSAPRIIEYNVKLKPNTKYLVRLLHKKHKPHDMKAFFKKDSVALILDNVRSDIAYAVLDYRGESDCHLKLRNDSNYIDDFVFIESEVLPDFYSEKTHAYDFKKLPYLWGTYDKKVGTEPILFESKTALTINKSNPDTITIPSDLDKTSGNTLVLT
jgi:hypothetical protein